MSLTIKTIFDYLFALILAVITLPIILLAIIMIKICSPESPAIFKQKRVGYKGKIFTIYKLRTMTNEKDENGELLPDEMRLKKWGKIIRKTSIDELTQVWNILLHQMSFIGPRPLLEKEMVVMSEYEQSVRQSILPGITGWEAVNEKDTSTRRDMAEYDLYYVRHWSLFFDFKICVMTAFILFFGRRPDDDVRAPKLNADDTLEQNQGKLVYTKKYREIGSYIDLQLRSGNEMYKGANVIRLNSGRAGIYHAVRVYGVNKVYLPIYECDTVRDFLIKKGVEVKYYEIDNNFNPIDLLPESDSAVVIVNHYGVMGNSRLKKLAKKYKNVIIDNAQGFFAKPVKNALNVYSARKFVGVPDGAYVVGNNARDYFDEYSRDNSSDTSRFLLLRCEYGLEGKSYEDRKINEQRIDNSDILLMSELTYKILDGEDYKGNKKARRKNFNYAHKLFKGINKINPKKYYSRSTVPFVYPLVVEDDGLIEEMQKNKVFQGRWWSYILNETDGGFSNYLSRYIVPITIDGRYDDTDIFYMANVIFEYLKRGK